MRPLRVLHVLGAMNRGGVETWLMHFLRYVDRERFQVDLLVHTDQPAVYDSDVLALGSRIFHCPHTGNPAAYARRFLQILKVSGPFDVLHSHVHHFSGLVLILGRLAGIPVRIAHSHNDTVSAESKARLTRRIYLGAMERLIRSHFTAGLAVSEKAALALFGPQWREDPRIRVFYCGIDLAPFQTRFDRADVRAEFHFSAHDVIFGHVGRFDPQKNHSFLLETAACILKHEPRAKFLLVGNGPLRPEAEVHAGLLGLNGRIIFAGLRSDIPRLMLGGMDVFLLPSIHEGLPLVLMETQAAGLPSVVADVITEEAVVNPALVQRLPLSAGPDVWARVATEKAKASSFDRCKATEALKNGRFDIMNSIRTLCKIHLENFSASRSKRVGARGAAADKRA